MKSKKENNNYLEKVPTIKSGLKWSKDENGVVLEAENKGIANKIAQKLIKKPKISYIHLDEIGSFVWLLTDGKKDILSLGKEVHEKFGSKAEPLYERLTQYFKILENNDFIELH